MKKLLPLLFLLALAACTPRAATETAPPSPSVPPTEPTKEAQEEVHLEFYDQIDWYNGLIDGNDFFLSEVQKDGELFYRFENEEQGVVILASPTGDGSSHNAVISFRGQSLTFEMPVFILGYGIVSGVASLHLEDLTGDGVPEMVYIYGGGGTGTWHANAKVFDLASMAEYPVSWDNALLQEAVSLRPIGLLEGSAIFEITAPDGGVTYGSTYYGGDSLPEEVPHSFGGHEGLSVGDGQLLLTSSFTADIIPNHPGVFYLGSLTAPLVYDAPSGSFSLRPGFELTVAEPLDILSLWQADLTHDGVDETVSVLRLDEDGKEFWVTVTNADGEILWQDRAGAYRGGGYNGVFLYQWEGAHYLMHWRPTVSQGIYFPSYRIFSLNDSGGTVTFKEGGIQYGAISEEELLALDTDAIRSFESEVNALLADSTVLISTYDDEAVWSTSDSPWAPLWDGEADEWEARQNAAREQE